MKITANNIASFLSNFVKDRTHKVLLFYGQEEELIIEYVHTIKDNLKSLYTFEVVDAENPSFINVIINEMMTISMFGEKKILYLPHFKKTDGKQIAELLHRISSDAQNILIIVHNDSLDASSPVRKTCESTNYFASIGVYKEEASALQLFAQNMMDSLKMKYTNDISLLLSELFVGNKPALKHEIIKLSTYMLGNNAEIDRNTVLKVVNPATQHDIFEIQSYVFDKNLQKALDVIQCAQVCDVSPILVLATISSYTRKIYTIKSAIVLNAHEDVQSLIKKNGIFFKQAGSIVKHINHYSMNQIVNIVSLLNDLEVCVRGNANIAYNHIKNFIVNQCS